MSMHTQHCVSGYSATVQLLARVNGQTHRLTHVGPDEIVFAEPLAINPGRIWIDVVVDDEASAYHADIEHSFPEGTTRVPITLRNHGLAGTQSSE